MEDISLNGFGYVPPKNPGSDGTKGTENTNDTNAEEKITNYIQDIINRLSSGDLSALEELDKLGIKYTKGKSGSKTTIDFYYKGENYHIEFSDFTPKINPKATITEHPLPFLSPIDTSLRINKPGTIPDVPNMHDDDPDGPELNGDINPPNDDKPDDIHDDDPDGPKLSEDISPPNDDDPDETDDPDGPKLSEDISPPNDDKPDNKPIDDDPDKKSEKY